VILPHHRSLVGRRLQFLDRILDVRILFVAPVQFERRTHWAVGDVRLADFLQIASDGLSKVDEKRVKQELDEFRLRVLVSGPERCDDERSGHDRRKGHIKGRAQHIDKSALRQVAVARQ